jgi:hypothetical protein
VRTDTAGNTEAVDGSGGTVFHAGTPMMLDKILFGLLIA